LRAVGGGREAQLLEAQRVLWLVVAPLAAEYALLRVAVLHAEPLVWLAALVAADMGAFVWLAGVLLATLALAARGAASAPLLLTRKAFHVAALVLLAPPVLHALARGSSLAFLQVACAGALQLALLAELLRASLPPRAPLRRAIDAALQPFRDSRDAEPLVLSHLYLIAGCCLPVVLAGAGGGGGAAAAAPGSVALLALAGVLAALGDAAAAAAGLAAGARGMALPWARVLGIGRSRGAPATLARKTVQGTAAFAASATVASLAVKWLAEVGGGGGGGAWDLRALAVIAGSATAAAGVETLTAGVDNLLLPFAYYVVLHVGLRAMTA